MHMYGNAASLQAFYSTVQGKVVERSIRRKIIKLWGNSAKGDRVVGFGYAAPYMPAISSEALYALSLLSHEHLSLDSNFQTNIPTALCDDYAWPVESNSVNRIIIVHGMGGDESVASILQEAWRVLVGQGRILIIVPNRSGIWSRIDNNPFGHGVPYSIGQMQSLLKDHHFTSERHERALFFPPSTSRTLLAASGIWEKIGDNFFNALGGVNIIEASKQTYAGMVTDSAAVAANKRKLLLQTKTNVTTADIYNKN